MPSDLRDLPVPDVGRPWVAVHLTGEQDLATAPELRCRLADLLGPGDRDVVVDLGGVTFFDTSALDVLLDAHRLGVATGAGLFLRDVPEHVRRVLRITGMGRLLPVR
ncbi:MAG: STAS domain-containing protein [Actinomycetota bacterium]|nr:STAS domain-containing protein [Actinomycetota bacterium]